VTLTASRLRSLADTLLDVQVVGTRGRRALRGLPVGDARPQRVEAWPADPQVGSRLGERDDGGTAFSLSNAFAASVTAMVDALLGGQPVPTSGTDGLAALLMDQAVVQAHRLGVRVRL
jgi:hypothetical protein